MEAVNTSWRSYKCRFKKNHFYAYAIDELRWENKPDTISVPQFQDLLNYWKCEKVEVFNEISLYVHVIMGVSSCNLLFLSHRKKVRPT